MEVEYEEDDYVLESNINNLRGEHEPNEHWEIRREFLIAHRANLPRRRLLCLSQTYCNIETLGCLYPPETMELVADLAKDIGQAHRERQQGQIQRHMVDASAAAEQRIRSRTRNTPSDPPTSAAAPSQARVVYGPPVTTGPRVTYGPPVTGGRSAEQNASSNSPRYGGVRTYNTSNTN